MSKIDVYTDLTGIASARVVELLQGDHLNALDVEAAVNAGKLNKLDFPGLVGGRLEDLVRRRYAQAQVSAADGLVAQVSAPHVSWLGGVLLTAEVVKTAAGLPPLDRRVEVDLTGVPLGGWRRPARDPSGRCICRNPTRRLFAKRLYAA